MGRPPISKVSCLKVPVSESALLMGNRKGAFALSAAKESTRRVRVGPTSKSRAVVRIRSSSRRLLLSGARSIQIMKLTSNLLKKMTTPALVRSAQPDSSALDYPNRPSFDSFIKFL